MAREPLAAPVSSAGIERMFYRAGKMHDDLKKKTSETTLERNLKVGTLRAVHSSTFQLTGARHVMRRHIDKDRRKRETGLVLIRPCMKASVNTRL